MSDQATDEPSPQQPSSPKIDPFHVFAGAPAWVRLRTVGADFRSLCDARREYMKWWSNTGGCGLCREEGRYTFQEPFCGYCWTHRLVKPRQLTGYCTRRLCSVGVLPVWFNGWHHGLPLDAWFDVEALPPGCTVMIPKLTHSM